MCAGFAVRYCQMPHGPMDSTAYRFDADGKSIGYAVDFSAITRSMVDLLTGVDVLVVDCLRREPHPDACASGDVT
jgi:phosphoribosyl 1,2-cyclic phosphate phosphodiesterase